ALPIPIDRPREPVFERGDRAPSQRRCRRLRIGDANLLESAVFYRTETRRDLGSDELRQPLDDLSDGTQLAGTDVHRSAVDTLRGRSRQKRVGDVVDVDPVDAALAARHFRRISAEER